MKQAMSLILALILCLSLCACGNQEKYKKYDTLIGYIEAGDEENATKEFLALLEQNKPETTEPATTTVEITMDNWQEYFEIRPYEEKQYNAFGEQTNRFTGEGLYLKEEYLSRLTTTAVNGAFKLAVTRQWCEYDEENDVLVENGRIFADSPETEECVANIGDFRNSFDTDICVSTNHGQVGSTLLTDSILWASNVTYKDVITNIEVLDVTGILEFYE